MTIKAYGYSQGEEEQESPMFLNEVTFVAEPARLRRLAEFLNHAADLIERHGETFGHEHFADFCGGLSEGSTDVIVSK